MSEGAISNDQIQVVRQDVERLMGGDNSGHGIDHIERVHRLAMSFADELPGTDRGIVELAALLHDVDDYKIVGREATKQLPNATEVMTKASINEARITAVKGIISTMGYSKSLRGIRPDSLEGKIVSDADMCDAIGASGAIRCLQYTLSDKGSGLIFDPAVWPNVEITADQYGSDGATHSTDSFVNHHFEKLLKLRCMMMTAPGMTEAEARDDVMVSFIRQFFIEQNQPEWSKFLDKYLASR